MPTQLDIRQSVYRSALNMAGTAANATVDGILAAYDPEIGKLFEDRNVLLTDGGTITFTGTQVQFTENLNITLNQKISGAVPQVISLGSSSQNFVSSGDMWVAVLNRTAGTATTSIITAGSPLPAVSNANQEVFLIAKRVDAGDGTQRLYWRNGFAMNAGQTLRLGQGGGTGTGVGGGSDLNSLQFRAQFIESFTESTTSAVTAVNGSAGFTNAVYSAAKQMYTINYDASKTMNTTGTAATLSGTPSFTVAAGDVVVNLTTLEVKKITVVTTQTSYTLESAFASNLSTQSVCVSQAVHTKDIYNYNANSTAASLAQAFPSSTFSEIMVDYEDNATSGSNLWTPDTAPFAAFSASTDNSNWTTSQVRSTNETDTMQSDICPTAGTSLYIRFFSDKTSGTGFVNLLNYEAFMQKSAANTAGGIVWSAYGTSNNSTTAINCTISVVGGKTTLTFTNGNQYAIGVNSGQTWGVLDVMLNGQLLPRFVAGSVPTTDGYYTEVSGTIIQLDKDYSSVQLEIQVVLRTQIVDTSTTNTTSITNLQTMISGAFQGFINPTDNVITATTNTGTPVAGTFYSTIPNRASMIDLSQDLKPRMGIDRISMQSVAQIQTEFGPNGEPVWIVTNDTYGQIRFVGGGVTNNNDSQGPRPVLGTTSDYCEITFYGTGLNLLLSGPGTTNLSYSLDGGSTTSFFNATTSTIFQTRNYLLNTPLLVVSNLTLGIHTVKITTGNASQGIAGFEVVNSSSNVTVPPGIGYIQGKKYVSALSTFAYTAPVSGTAGGRVLIYQNANGTIGQAFTASPGSGSFLTSASHTNEEVVRVYSPREFGAGNSFDFSRVSGSQASAYTLDDGTTTLLASSCNFSTQNGVEGLSFGAINQPVTLTFVGTGVDVVVNSASFVGTVQYSIDGAANATIGTINNGIFTTKIVSGLPYGTHTLRLTATVLTSGGLALNKFIVYQPKTPALPSGTFQIGSYNVMATFVANSTQGAQFLGTGVLRKLITREPVLEGTWSISAQDNNSMGGFLAVSTTSAANFVQYQFFGTGFDFRLSGNSASSTFTLSIDGSSVLNASNSSPTGGGAGWTGALTTGAYGATVSLTASTGVITSTAGAGADGCGVWANGMTLGMHTVKVTWTSGTGDLNVDAFDIITPIHSPKFNIYSDLQNTLPIGSQAISDDRQNTPVKNAIPATKALAFATGISATPTTGSSAMVPMPDMSCTVKTSGGPLQLLFEGVFQTNSNFGSLSTQFYVDGIAIGGVRQVNVPGTSENGELLNMQTVQVGPGFHKVDVYWGGVGNGATTATASGTERTLTVREL